ncbi:MAG: SGNH/GDSL hydrolase family protein [Cellvibrionales bacterium]|nr:SGNH/GDSL hydrolase family protein [Cellvibrionales bacterium]
MRVFFSWILKVLSNIAAVIIGLVMALLLAEVLVRIFSPHPDYGGGIRPAFYSHLFEYDKLLGWRGVKNLSTPYYSKDFHVTVSHDAAGYRDMYPAYVEGKKNYLLLGDSYAWGWGVEDNETAAAVFSRKNTDKNLYSLGIAGYGTDQEWLSLQQFLEQHPTYQYQGVILEFYFNDFDDNAATERYAYPKPAFVASGDELRLTNVPVPYREVEQSIPVTEIPEPNDWSSRVQVLSFIAHHMPGVIAFIQRRGKPEVLPTLTPVMHDKVLLAAQLLSEIRQYCEKRGMFFHAVILQTQDTQGENLVAIRALAEELDKRGVAHSLFKSRYLPSTDLWLDAHLNPYGQALLADHIEEVTESAALQNTRIHQ